VFAGDVYAEIEVMKMVMELRVTESGWYVCKSYCIGSWFATMYGPAIVMVRIVRLSVCCMRISPKLSKIDLWLLLNVNRNLGFPIQNLPSDLRSEVQFCHFGCFQVGTSPIQTEMGRLVFDCSDWISGNSHQLAPHPHWAPWRASYRHVP